MQIIAPIATAAKPVNTIQNGQGAPSNAIGINNDFYIDTQNARLYGPKVNNAWPTSYISIGGSGGGGGSIALSPAVSITVSVAGAQTLTLPISNPDYAELYYNGQRQPSAIFSISGTTMTVSADLGADVGDTLTAVCGSAQSSSGSSAQLVDEVPSGALDSNNVTYTLTYTPRTNSLSLFRNGNFVDPSSYTLSNKTITLNPAPVVTDTLRARYSVS